MNFADSSKPLEQPKLLIVEGKDEVNFFDAIKNHIGKTDLEIRHFGGVNNLRGYLEVLKGIEGFERVVSLGVIRDAEEDAAAAFKSVRDGLRSAGFPLPTLPLQVAVGIPQVVVLINPHGKNSGSLEDICLQAVSGSPFLNCVDLYVECLRKLGPPARESKTRVHAFIAGRDRPEVSLGVAAKQGYFPLNHAAFGPTRQLLTML